MHFFQRGFSGSAGEAASFNYDKYIEENKTLYSEQMLRFNRQSAHDDIVESVCWTAAKRLVIRTNWHDIIFEGVERTNVDWRLIGQGIMVHEVHPADNNLYQILILLGNSECAIVASEARIEDRTIR